MDKAPQGIFRLGYMLKEEKGMGRRRQWNEKRKKDKNEEN